MKLGAGMQYKILDAAGAGRACVISPVANMGIGLEDGRSALVRAGEGEAFAEAIVAPLADRDERARLTVVAQRTIPVRALDGPESWSAYRATPAGVERESSYRCLRVARSAAT